LFAYLETNGYLYILYRLFAFWDTETETLVVATHGIIKKTQKTPQKEIQRAEEIRKEYFNEKNNIL
jgi:phage-related protein